MNKEKFLKITICSIVLICTIVTLFYYTALFDYYKGVKPVIKNLYNIEYLKFIGRQPVTIPAESGDKFNFGVCSYIRTECKNECNFVPLKCVLVSRKPVKLFILINETEDTKFKEFLKGNIEDCEVK